MQIGCPCIRIIPVVQDDSGPYDELLANQLDLIAIFQLSEA
ncbi:MAG: hypothetical protein RLY31_1661 [Bacteroidota bacterium]